MIRRSSRSRRMTNTTIPPTANRREFKRTFLLTTRPPDHCRRKWTRNSTSTIRWERAHTINERSPRCGALPFRATCGETSPRAISTGCIATRSRVWRAAHFRRGGAAGRRPSRAAARFCSGLWPAARAGHGRDRAGKRAAADSIGTDDKARESSPASSRTFRPPPVRAAFRRRRRGAPRIGGGWRCSG